MGTLFFKKKKWAVGWFLWFCFNVSFNFNKTKFFNLSDLHHYNNLIFWKLTSCLNNLKLNLLVGFILVILFLNYFNQTPGLSTKTVFFWLLWVLLLVPDTCGVLYSMHFFSKKINVALLNGVVNVHPWLTFISYSFLGWVAVIWWTPVFLKKLIVNFFFKKNSLKLFGFVIITWSICLGAYWSFQELSWGGWWNWDVIELMSLNFFFIISALTHFQFFQLFKKKQTLTKIFLIILVASIVVRLNLLSSIHAFINPNLTKIFFVKIFLILTLLAFFLNSSVYERFENRIKKKNLLFYFYHSILVVVAYIAYYLIVVFVMREDNVEWSPIIIFLFIWWAIFFFNNFISLKTCCKSIQLWPFNYIFFLASLVLGKIKNRSNTQGQIARLHVRAVVFMLIVFFLKTYSIGFNFLEEIFFGNYTQSMFTHYYGNNFFKKMSTSPTILNVLGCDMFRYLGHSPFALGGGWATHFWKNSLLLYNWCLVKIMYLNNNTVALLYTGWFLLLIHLVLTSFFKKKVYLKIN